MADVTRTRMRAEEFLALPESILRTELIDGEVVMAPAPELRHQDLVFVLAKLVEKLAPGGTVRIAPVDVYLDEDNVVQPDVLWLAPESQCVPVGGKYLRGAPDLVVEVLSPGSTRHDKVDKFRLYEKHGVREYWIVEPSEQFFEVWLLADARYAHQGVYAPDESFECPVLGKRVNLKLIFT